MDKFLQTISSIVDSGVSWVTNHPKTSLAIAIFVFGFILGLIF
jgi:hypothetical protein